MKFRSGQSVHFRYVAKTGNQDQKIWKAFVYTTTGHELCELGDMPNDLLAAVAKLRKAVAGQDIKVVYDQSAPRVVSFK